MVGLNSDTGNVRMLNEDFAAYLISDNLQLYIVADGMGGHNAGEVASKMVVDLVLNYFENVTTVESNMLKESIERANKEIYKYGRSVLECIGMGTTITACLITKESIEIANVGDSSCLGVNEDKIEKLTKDHSLVQELVDSGSLTEEEALLHPKRNIITRAIGTSEEVNIDLYKLKSGEYKEFLLCTDGLTNEVDKNEMFSIINESKDYSEACEKLVSLAKSRGGRDNITVLLFGGEM